MCLYIFSFWTVLILFGSCSISSLSYPHTLYFSLSLSISLFLYLWGIVRQEKTKQAQRLKHQKEMENEKEHISVFYFIFPHISVLSKRIKWRKAKRHYNCSTGTDRERDRLCFFRSVCFFSFHLVVFAERARDSAYMHIDYAPEAELHRLEFVNHEKPCAVFNKLSAHAIHICCLRSVECMVRCSPDKTIQAYWVIVFHQVCASTRASVLHCIAACSHI